STTQTTTQSSRSGLASSPTAFSRGQSTDGTADLLVDTSYYNFYQPSRYPAAYYSNLYNHQQYQMPNGESRLSSHKVSPQYRMRSYYSSASYLSQGLGQGLACVPPIFSLEDNNTCHETNFSSTSQKGCFHQPNILGRIFGRIQADTGLTWRRAACS
uniref:Uncharacterized protein n=1 Tax=Salmo trutta TaxID=8032 RepID=A0A674DVD9_SALTR